MAAEQNQPPSLAEIGERAWLRRVRRWVERQPAARRERLVVGVGDDAAVLKLGDPRLVVTTDALIEGVHFRPEWTAPRDLGWKAMAANLSDLAAMAARPVAALLSLSLPGESLTHDVEALFRGMLEAGRRWGCPLAGGDLTRAPQWCLALTLLGEPMRRGRVARRDTARAGDQLYVTGAPGESGAGLEALRRGLKGKAPAGLIRRHQRPTPRLAEAEVLIHCCRRLTMLDVSDGIWNDASQLAEASGAGIDLEASRLPVSRPLRRLGAALNVDPLDWVLFGGEDYELLFAAGESEERIERAFGAAGVATPVSRIGVVRKGRGVRLLDERGRPIPRADRTFQHFQESEPWRNPSAKS